ncbi:hypothetical protein KP509_23G003600 [Ceratopteris richardii]|uniref:Retrotransposon gag domain-containing protein n=1 Tax=Ceratopteris richardii TaxID=49495 RepID=A0A8T2RYZ0_CERRI|nr:hypothetical protein KP509_23G003600 [Ceratopteris richardii]
MAQRHATPLGDFPCFLGCLDEDPDGHIQLFEVICGAHEIVDEDRKLRIFPLTLRGDASEWYRNLGVHERTTYDNLKTNFLRKFRGASESIDQYIDRMDTIVRKLGNSVPDNETLKRRFLVGLHDGKVEEYIRLKRPVSLEEAKHEARVWEEVQCVLQMHIDRLNAHSRGLGENQESSKIVKIIEEKHSTVLKNRVHYNQTVNGKERGYVVQMVGMVVYFEPIKNQEDGILKRMNLNPRPHIQKVQFHSRGLVCWTCNQRGQCPSLQGSRSDALMNRYDRTKDHLKDENTTNVSKTTNGDVSTSPCLSPNFMRVEFPKEYRCKVQSRPGRKIIVNQDVPEVGVVPQAQIIRSEGRIGGDGKPNKQEPMHARDKDEHKNDAIITSQIVAKVECEALKDVELQCKVQKLECELEKLRAVVSHLERELAQEKELRLQQVEKVKEVERVTHEWFKDTQDIRDKESKRIDQLVQENEGFRELIKRWEIDRKIQRKRIVSEMEKCKELEQKVEALMEKVQNWERTEIEKVESKQNGERLSSRHVEIGERRTKKELKIREKVSGERVVVTDESVLSSVARWRCSTRGG